MKKFNLIFILAAVFGLAFLTSCGEDDVEQLPLLEVTPSGLGAGNTIAEGELFAIAVTAGENPESKSQLDNLVVQTPGPDENIDINASTYSNSFDYNAPAAGQEATYTFILTDKSGEVNTKSVTVTGESGVISTPFPETETGNIYHMSGASGCTGGYDLVSDAAVPGTTGADADRDMLNTNMPATAFTGGFEAKNATTYVKDNSYDYANADVETATAAFASGTATSTVTAPAVGDVYIAKLRGGSDYAVMSITFLDPLDNSCNPSTQNRGRMTFEYKK